MAKKPSVDDMHIAAQWLDIYEGEISMIMFFDEMDKLLVEYMYLKALSYAYPHSPNAERLGHKETGCYYIEQIPCGIGLRAIGRIWPGTEGFCDINDPDLRTLWDEIDAPASVYSKQFPPE